MRAVKKEGDGGGDDEGEGGGRSMRSRAGARRGGRIW